MSLTFTIAENDVIFAASISQSAPFREISATRLSQRFFSQLLSMTTPRASKVKGIDFAMDRLNCHLQRHFRKHGLKGGILVFDFKDYFGSAQHWTVKSELARSCSRPEDQKARE